MYDSDHYIEENKILTRKIENLENKLQQLDLQIFYLKTLYDINQEISPFKSTHAIIKAFLMMIMGLFGISQGFLLIIDKEIWKIDCFESRMIEDGIMQQIIALFGTFASDIFSQKEILAFFEQKAEGDIPLMRDKEREVFNLFTAKGIYSFLPFSIDQKYCGAIGLGKRITWKPFTQIDREVLSTLINQLMIKIANVKAYEIIIELNEDLKNKNRDLEETLVKVQLLEKIKALLCKFVPKTLERLIDAQPDSPDLDKKNLDISVLFLDIQGFSAISEKLKYEETTRLIETYFSYFLDDIFHYGGDINMVLGDGLMIIFHDEDLIKHAINAVKTALALKQKSIIVNSKLLYSQEPLMINIGVHSGIACIGANRLEGYYGSRWTYTALGPTVNIAAIIGSFAKNGEILASEFTISRVKNMFLFENLGPQRLKNINQEMDIYKIKSANDSESL